MKVIILNGPMGVGKTTVGKYIAETNKGNGIKLRKSRITHSVVWDFFMEKY